MTGDGQGTSEIFATLVSFLKLLGVQDCFDLIARSFEMRFLDGIGLIPHLSGCVICRENPAGRKNYFSSSKGGMVCLDCAGRSGVSGLIPLSLRYGLFSPLGLEVRRC